MVKAQKIYSSMYNFSFEKSNQKSADRIVRVGGGCEPLFFLTHLVNHLLAVISGEGADVEVGTGAREQSLCQPAAAAPPLQ